MVELGLVLVEFGKMEGKAFQVRNPHGCKQTKRADRRDGEEDSQIEGKRLSEIRLSWYRGNIVENTGSRAEKLRFFCGRLQVTLVCF